MQSVSVRKMERFPVYSLPPTPPPPLPTKQAGPTGRCYWPVCVNNVMPCGRAKMDENVVPLGCSAKAEVKRDTNPTGWVHKNDTTLQNVHHFNEEFRYGCDEARRTGFLPQRDRMKKTVWEEAVILLGWRY